MGEIDSSDIYHHFKPYREDMRAWIHDISEGESAFDNEDINKRPHKIVDGEIVVHNNKHGDKYTRQCWDKVGPCVHTYMANLASQNTVHPVDDRAFSIRELLLMNIPNNFKWSEISEEELNNLPLEEKITHKLDMEYEPQNRFIKSGEKVLMLINDKNEGLFLPLRCNVMYKHGQHIIGNLNINKNTSYETELKNKELIINNSNFMLSYKDLFDTFMIKNGNDININSQFYTWDNYADLILSVYDWRNKLNDIVLSNENNEESKNFKEDFAIELAESEKIFASNPDYIKQFWLSDPQRIIKTDSEILKIYDIATPRRLLKDLTEIFNIISKYNHSIDVQESSFRNYLAIKQIRHLRNIFLKRENIPIKYKHLCAEFWKELDYIVKKQDSFKVIVCKREKLVKPVVPFKKYYDYDEYISQ